RKTATLNSTEIKERPAMIKNQPLSFQLTPTDEVVKQADGRQLAAALATHNFVAQSEHQANLLN
ncbi:34897_t:CDS:2, partial [Racocetra persica]